LKFEWEGESYTTGDDDDTDCPWVAGGATALKVTTDLHFSGHESSVNMSDGRYITHGEYVGFRVSQEGAAVGHG